MAAQGFKCHVQTQAGTRHKQTESNLVIFFIAEINFSLARHISRATCHAAPRMLLSEDATQDGFANPVSICSAKAILT